MCLNRVLTNYPLTKHTITLSNAVVILVALTLVTLWEAIWVVCFNKDILPKKPLTGLCLLHPGVVKIYELPQRTAVWMGHYRMDTRRQYDATRADLRIAVGQWLVKLWSVDGQKLKQWPKSNVRSVNKNPASLVARYQDAKRAHTLKGPSFIECLLGSESITDGIQGEEHRYEQTVCFFFALPIKEFGQPPVPYSPASFSPIFDWLHSIKHYLNVKPIPKKQYPE